MVRVRENGQQKTCNLFCNIAAKGIAKRRCAFYHPHQTTGAQAHVTSVLINVLNTEPVSRYK